MDLHRAKLQQPELVADGEKAAAAAIGKRFSVQYKVGQRKEIRRGNVSRCEVAGIRQTPSRNSIIWHVWIDGAYVGMVNKIPR